MRRWKVSKKCEDDLFNYYLESEMNYVEFFVIRRLVNKEYYDKEYYLNVLEFEDKLIVND